ncbi:MAG: ElyC/SanA/YdcF family protein, partial [bacterium]
YDILAPVHRVNAEVLVLEGYVTDYVIDSAVREFKRGNYKLLITTGTPLETGHLLIAYDNTANVAYATLLRSGFDSTRLVTVPSKEIRNDRTYNSAKELAKWLKLNRPDVRSINLMTMSVHGGRSRMLFQSAMGDAYKVGIISIKNYYYGKDNWWKTGKGFRETLNEAIGYFYVRFFFRPY